MRFERLLEEARAAPAGARGALLADALALWRGPALDDLAFEPFAGAEIARLDGLRLDAEEERLAGELGLGRHDHLVPELESLVAANPLRERLRGQLMLALYRSGRQAEALEVYRAARLALADELGLDPSPELQRLERAILRHDPALDDPRQEPEPELPSAPRERRVVSVLAAAPSALDDPELLLASLEALLERTRSILQRYGGTLERFGPEGLVATFSGRDDDALRAVRAASELGAARRSLDGRGGSRRSGRGRRGRHARVRARAPRRRAPPRRAHLRARPRRGQGRAGRRRLPRHQRSTRSRKAGRGGTICRSSVASTSSSVCAARSTRR